MDASLLVVIVAAVGIFLGRMLLIARSLRAAARDPGSVDPTALREVKKTLTMHEELRAAAVEEPRRQLAEAKAYMRAFRPPRGSGRRDT